MKLKMKNLLSIKIEIDLILREISASDIDQLVAVIGSNKDFFRRNDSWMAQITTRDQVLELIQKAERTKKENTGARFALWKHDELLGHFNIFDMDKHHEKAQIGYWLSEKFNGKGYASKALKALVKFGFEVFDLHRIEATTATTNESSIRLLERVGFNREGLLREVYWNEKRFVDDYIYALLDTDQQIESVNKASGNSSPIVVSATPADQETIQNMARFYVYEMSRSCGQMTGWEMPANGLYECSDLSRYFIDKDRFPFLIRVQEELAGFVLVNKVGTSPDIDWNIGEFFVLAKFQGSGIGKEIAFQIFDRFEGIWEVAQMPKNLPAVKFWKKVVSEYASGFFKETSQVIHEPTLHPMIVLKFESKKGPSNQPLWI